MRLQHFMKAPRHKPLFVDIGGYITQEGKVGLLYDIIVV